MPQYLIEQNVANFLRQLKSEYPRISDAVNRVMHLSGGPGVHVHNTPSGITISSPQKKDRPAPQTQQSKDKLIHIDGNRTGGGKYSGHIVQPATDALSYAGNLSSAEIAGSDGDEVTVINPHERDKSTHALTAGTPVCLHFTCVATGGLDEGDFPVYRIIDGFDIKSCV